jgi:hypothetical protein
MGRASSTSEMKAVVGRSEGRRLLGRILIIWNYDIIIYPEK